MALLLADGFDLYANDTQWLEAGWARQSVNSAINTTGGRFGGGAVESSSNSAFFCGARVAVGGTVIVGFSYMHDGNGGADDTPLQGIGYFGAQLFRIGHNTDGDLFAFNAGGSQVGSTAMDAIPPDTWVWVEVKVVLGTDNSSGSIEVKVDGSTVIGPVGSIDTFGGGSDDDLAGLYFYGGDGVHWHDDIVIMDGTGSFMADFIGPTRIDTLSPAAAGGVTDWTANTGTQAEAVDDTPNAVDDDTTYISSATAAQEARFVMGDLTVEPDTIHGLQVRMRARKPDAGTRTYRALLNVSGSESTGPTLGAPTQYAWLRCGVFYEDPATDPWDATAVNAMQAGVEIVA